jgi:hypothetical protein
MSRDPRPDDGALVAMDQVGQWVRYADTKAGLVAAGFAAVLVLITGQVDDVVTTMKSGRDWMAVCIVLAVLVVAAAVITLWNLIDAIVPRPRGEGPVNNRFAWPALKEMDRSGLRAHLAATTVADDAWEQTLALAKIADQKYEAARAALAALMFFTLTGTVLVVGAGSLAA